MAECDYNQREKSIISNSLPSNKTGSDKKGKVKKVVDRVNTQKSILTLGFVQMKEDENVSQSHKMDKTVSNEESIQEIQLENIGKVKKKSINTRDQVKISKEGGDESETANIRKKDTNPLIGYEKYQESSDDMNPNYNQQFFNYKSFNPSTTNTNPILKRKNSVSKDVGGKKSKKINKNWITKEPNKTDKIIELKDEDNIQITNKKNNSDFSDEEIVNDNKSSNISELKSLMDTNMINNNNNLNNILSSTSNNINIRLNNLDNNLNIKGKNAINKSKIKNNITGEHSKSTSSQATVEFNSRIQSKDKNYNFNNQIVIKANKEEVPKFTKFNDYLQFKKANQKIQQRDRLIDNINDSMISIDKNNKKDLSDKTKDRGKGIAVPDAKMYDLELKSLDDSAYDEFYKLKHNNKTNANKILPLNIKNYKPKNLNVVNGIINQRNKKEREKMNGYKCELCEKFYDTIDEKHDDTVCNNCSRHRAEAKPNLTPKGFYDLSF